MNKFSATVDRVFSSWYHFNELEESLKTPETTPKSEKKPGKIHKSGNNVREYKIKQKNTNNAREYKIKPKKTSKAMLNSGRILVLSAFSPYLHLLKAFNADNFHQKDWRSILHSIFDAFTLAMIIFLIPFYCGLDFWNLIDSGADMKKIVVALPLIISGLQFVVIYIALVLANHTISETVSRLQEAIDRRKYLCVNLFRRVQKINKNSF